MHPDLHTFNMDQLPHSADAELAESGVIRWLDALEEVGDEDVLFLGRSVSEDSDGRRLCDSIFGNSKYLLNSASKEPEYFCDLLTLGPEACYKSTAEFLSKLLDNDPSFEQLSTDLRRAKTQAALAIAFADISNQWHVRELTKALTDIADSALNVATNYGLIQLAKKGAITLPNAEAPSEGSGLIILGMGKQGAYELNYSSDIDIIILFDPDKTQTKSPGNLQRHFIRLSQNLVKLLDDRTADGYVFRTDLRLRPDPGATPIAISIKSARVYYANRARNWERAAFIKARPVAGDIEAGESFLEELETFIWKGDLDFASIREIRTIKRQIDEHKNHGAIMALGHNVKLGRGGIREIEFIAQAQQLVWGGRQKNLRCRPTIETLDTLVKEQKVSQKQAEKLKYAYYYLRRVEHRIQMINDEQTHSIPTDEEKFGELAIFLGYQDSQSFEDALLDQLNVVDDIFVHTFETSLIPDGEEMLSNAALFSTEDSIESVLKALSDFGFTDPHRSQLTIAAWLESDRMSDDITSRLMDLLPTILQVFGKLEEPDRALERLGRLFARNSEGDHLYSLVMENPQLIGTISVIMDCAPELANQLAGDSKLLETVVLNDFFDSTPNIEDLQLEVAQLISGLKGISDFYRTLFRWSRDRKFQVAVQTLAGMIDHHLASASYFDITQCTFQTLANSVQSGPNDEAIGENIRLKAIAYSESSSEGMEWISDYKLIFIVEDTEDDGALKKAEKLLNKAVVTNTDLHSGISELSFQKEEQYSSEHTRRPTVIADGDKPTVFRSESFLEDLQYELVSSTDQAEAFVKIKNRLLKSMPTRGQDKGPDHAGILNSLPQWIRFLRSVADYLVLKNEPNPEKLNYSGCILKYETLRDNEHIDQNIANDLILILENLSASHHLMSMCHRGNESLISLDEIPLALKYKMAKVQDVADFEVVLDGLGDSIELASAHVYALIEVG